MHVPSRIGRVGLGAAALALVLFAAVAPLLFGAGADAAKHKPPKRPDVVLQSIKTGPDGGDPLHRTILVQLRNNGDRAVGPFALVLTADRDGASRPPQSSDPVSLGPNQTKTVEFLAIGCKWLNAANHATLTATTDPKPVPGELGRASNNTKTAAPNLDFSGHPECSGV